MIRLQWGARWVAQEFRGRGGDRHECFSETLGLALVKAVIAHVARRADQNDTFLAVFDVRRAYFHVEEKRDIVVELPESAPADVRTSRVEKAAQCTERYSASDWVMG